MERRHALGSLKRSYSGSMRSIRLRLESWFGSALRKKRGASSVSHLGSMAITLVRVRVRVKVRVRIRVRVGLGLG